MKFLRYRPSLRLAVVYALVAGVWIFISDRLLVLFIRDGRLLADLKLAADWAFVAATAVLLYLVLHRELQARKRIQIALRHQNEYLDALHATTLSLMKRLNVDELLSAIVTRAGALLETEHGYMDLLLPGEGRMETRVGLGVFKPYLGFRSPYGLGFTGKVWQTGQPLVVDDYDTWPDRRTDFNTGVLHALIGVPLKSDSKVTGVLALAHVERSHRFSKDQLELLKGFAELASLALDNAQLYTAARTELAERKRAEEQRREAEVKYQALVEEIPAVTYILSLHDRGMIYISPQVEDLLGYPRSDWLNDPKLWMNHLYPDDRERVLAEMAQTHNGRKLFSSEYRLFTRSGQVVWIRDEAVVVRNEIGEPQFIQGIMRDITQRKRAEEALQVSEERFRLLLDSTAEAIYGIDLRGNCTFANATCLRMLGYTDPAQVLGKDMHNLMHHTQPDGSPYPVETSPIYQVFAQSEAVHADDEVFWRADGTSFPVEYWAHPVCQEGSVFGAVVTFIDITERKQAEAKIRQTTARAMLLAEVSHTLAKAGSELPGVLESVARQIASQLGDACGILLLSDDEQVLKPVGLYHVDAEALAALRHRLAAVPLRVTDEFLRPVIQAGQPVLLLEVTPEQLRAWFAPSPHPAAERFSPRSISLVPLRLQDHIVGLLGVARPGQPYTADDQLLLQELADRVALAIANAHLLELARQELAERRRAEDALREHESRYRRLLEQAADPPVPESPRSP